MKHCVASLRHQSYLFKLFMFNLQVDAVSPLLLNASLLLVLTTDQ